MTGGGLVLARVDDAPLDVAAHLAAVQDPRAGAVAVFVGQVRDHDPGARARVVSLDYSAHPDAGHVLARIAGEVADDGARVAVSHRVGRLGVGELALVACVATAHRADAFERCRALVEAVKVGLPVWKRQWDADGDAGWVGL